MEDSFDVSPVPHGVLAAFGHTAAQNFLEASVFWVRRAVALGGEKATIEHEQITRAGGQRGIVEVISHD